MLALGTPDHASALPNAVELDPTVMWVNLISRGRSGLVVHMQRARAYTCHRRGF